MRGNKKDVDQSGEEEALGRRRRRRRPRRRLTPPAEVVHSEGKQSKCDRVDPQTT